VVYDTSKYYKSELKRHGSVEYEPPSNDGEDSDDDEDQSLLMTRLQYTLQVRGVLVDILLCSTKLMSPFLSVLFF